MSTLLLIMAALVGHAVEECPAQLVLKDVSNPALVQPYADCMSQLRLPVVGELAEKQQHCAHARVASVEASAMWVDHIAANLPGCETRIEFKRK